MDAEAKAFLGRSWAKLMFDGAAQHDLDMGIFAEEALVRAVALLLGEEDVEKVRAQVTAIFVGEIAKARALLEAKPAGRG